MADPVTPYPQEPPRRCCPEHPDWPTLGEHLLNDFPDAAITEVVRAIAQAKEAVDTIPPGHNALAIGESIARQHLLVVTGLTAYSLRLDPETHHRAEP